MIHMLIILMSVCTYHETYSCSTSHDSDYNTPQPMQIEQQDTAALFDTCKQAFLAFMPRVDTAAVAQKNEYKKVEYLRKLNYNDSCIASKKALIALGESNIESAAQFSLWALKQHPYVFSCLVNHHDEGKYEESKALSTLCLKIIASNAENITKMLIDHPCLRKIIKNGFMSKYKISPTLKDKAYEQCTHMPPDNNSALVYYVDHFMKKGDHDALINTLSTSPLGAAYADYLFTHGTPKSRTIAEDLSLKLLFEVRLCDCPQGEKCSTHANTVFYKHNAQVRNHALTCLAKHMPQDYKLMRYNQKAWDWYQNAHVGLHIARRGERLEGKLFLPKHIDVRPRKVVAQLAYYWVNPPSNLRFAALDDLKNASSLFAKGTVRDALLNAFADHREDKYKIFYPEDFFKALHYAFELSHDATDPCCNACTSYNDAILDEACVKLLKDYVKQWDDTQRTLSNYYTYSENQPLEADRQNCDLLRKTQSETLTAMNNILALSHSLTHQKTMQNALIRSYPLGYRKALLSDCDVQHLCEIARSAPLAYAEIIKATKNNYLRDLINTVVQKADNDAFVKQLPDDLQPSFMLHEIYYEIFQNDKPLISKNLTSNTYLTFLLAFLLEKLEPSHHHDAVHPIITSCALHIAQHYPTHLTLVENMVKKHAKHTECPIKKGIEPWYERLIKHKRFLTIPQHKTPKVTMSPAAKHTIARILYFIDQGKYKHLMRHYTYEIYHQAPSTGKKADAIIAMFAKSISPEGYAPDEYEVACAALLDFANVRNYLPIPSAEGENEHNAYCNAFTRLIADICVLGNFEKITDESNSVNNSHVYRIIKRIARHDSAFAAEPSYISDTLATYVASLLVPDTHKYEALSLLLNISGSIDLAHSNQKDFACTQWETNRSGQHFAAWYQLLYEAQDSTMPCNKRIAALHMLAHMPHAWQLVQDVCKRKAIGGTFTDKLVWAAADCFAHSAQSDSNCLIAQHVIKQSPEAYSALRKELTGYSAALKESAVRLLIACNQQTPKKIAQA